MIKLTFQSGREVMNFRVENRFIFYSDRIWNNEIRCIPKDEKFIKKIRESRNKLPPKLLTMFNLSKKAQEEYRSCKNDAELAAKIIEDCKKKGLKLLKREAKDGMG